MNFDTYKKRQITFGSSGGFANLVNEYRLLENRKLYHKRGTDSLFVALDRKEATEVKLIFDKARSLFGETKDFREPGNIYYFIRFKQDTITNEIVWGSSKENTPQKAKELYKELMNLVNLK